MRPKLKPLKEQVVVFTGASSGIDLVTARMAAARGARVVLAARNEEALRGICSDIRAQGGEATYVVADVGKHEHVRRIADTARSQYGGFDTWVNGAAVSIYGRLEETSLDDHRRLFDTNYWGVVYGSLIALEHLRAHGGAIINIGSTLSDRAFPLQGAYAASKHALKGFTDAFRMETEESGAPVSVTLIKPGPIDTPYTEHAKNYLPNEPKNPPPVYAPEAVAEAILYACEHPIRDIMVGAGGRLISTFGRLFPRFTDRLMERTAFRAQHSDRPARPRDEHNLYTSRDTGRERSRQGIMVFERSLYTRARLHPLTTGLAAFGLIAGVAALCRRWPRTSARHHSLR
jgi:short-subunit dehydrogenase